MDDKIAGEGELICKNGYVYKGQWKDNLVSMVHWPDRTSLIIFFVSCFSFLSVC